MLIIACYDSHTTWFPDIYIVQEANNMDHLKEMAKTDLPITCYKVDDRYCKTIINPREAYRCDVFLNNYLYYEERTPNYYIMEESEIDTLYDKQCSRCTKYHAHGGIDCRYKEANERMFECENYKEKFSSKLKRKLFN